MDVLVIGATGTIGRAVVETLSARHRVISAGSKSGDVRVDLVDPASVRAMARAVGRVGAIVCAAGNAAWKPLRDLTDEDFDFSMRHKLLGQVNVIRFGMDAVEDGGSITVTSGILGRTPAANGAAVSLVNAGLEGFVRAAALEAPRGIRVNVVSPPWVSETLSRMGQDPKGGLPASRVALAYVASMDGSGTGRTIEPA
jgi:NAD(P)-dependent dehydrogenase (short-subunit alcohol dehydrogenase family)